MAHIKEVDRAGGGVAYELHWRDHGRKRQLTFKKETTAERELHRIENLLESGRSTTHLTVRRTVEEVVEACIAASEGRLKQRTTDGYRSMAKKHIVPAFGRQRITSLRLADIEKWINGLAKKIGVGTVRNVFNLLNKACKYAMRHEYIVTNPCAGAELPTLHNEFSEDRHFLTPLQIEALAAALAAKQSHYGLIVRMSAYTGLRAGELAALRIRDVNLLRGVVQVRRTVHRRTGKGWVYTSPKSKKSVRDVPLMPALLGELRAWLAAHPAATDPDAPLWPGSKNTGKGGELDWSRPFDIGTMCKNHFRIIRKTLEGVPSELRWHDLRHTYASIMAVAGMDVRKVSIWMGHSSISVTEKIYTHLFAIDYTSDMAQVGAFLGGAGQTLSHAQTVTPLFGGAAAR